MYERELNTPFVLRTKLTEKIWLHTSDNDNVLIELNQGHININTRLTGLKLSEVWVDIDTKKNDNTKSIRLIKTEYLTPPEFVCIG